MSALRSEADIDRQFWNVRSGGQKGLDKKSSRSQGKIKGFFKIAGSPAATASAHFLAGQLAVSIVN
jgi:hypothetical protein